jgi:hypothetical protein
MFPDRDRDRLSTWPSITSCKMVTRAPVRLRLFAGISSLSSEPQASVPGSKARWPHKRLAKDNKFRSQANLRTTAGVSREAQQIDRAGGIRTHDFLKRNSSALASCGTARCQRSERCVAKVGFQAGKKHLVPPTNCARSHCRSWWTLPANSRTAFARPGNSGARR